MPSSDSSANQEQVTSSETEKPKGVRREQPNDPFHGITLETVVTKLVENFGWFELGQIITIKCFQKDPSIKSSLKFLRKTPWARKKVEALYLQTFG